MSKVKFITVKNLDNGMRVDRWFKKYYPRLQYNLLSKLIRTGQIRVDGSRIKSGFKVTGGEKVRIPPIGDIAPAYLKTKTYSTQNSDVEYLKDKILYIDENLIGINKPKGLAVQGGTKIIRHLDGMLDALRMGFDEKPRLVHRLDKDTSGVLILARTKSSAVKLGEDFRVNRIKKVYWALVSGVPKPSTGFIDAPLKKGIVENMEKFKVSLDGKNSVSHYRLLDNYRNKISWLSLEPLTGRTHQLRIHCSHIGHSILGDSKYGTKILKDNESSLSQAGLQLLSKGIKIPTETGEAIEIEAPLPTHMSKYWDKLGFKHSNVGKLFVDYTAVM